MEKAHRDVFNVLLQVLDDGRLTDNLGHTVDFTNTIIVMTSNLGATHVGPLGFGGGASDPEAPPMRTDARAIRAFFRPEFFNRIDHVVEFKPLGRSVIEQITYLLFMDWAKLIYIKLNNNG